jgi:hypothetical protein
MVTNTTTARIITRPTESCQAAAARLWPVRKGPY